MGVASGALHGVDGVPAMHSRREAIPNGQVNSQNGYVRCSLSETCFLTSKVLRTYLYKWLTANGHETPAQGQERC